MKIDKDALPAEGSLVRFILRSDRLRAGIMVALLTVAGVLEGFGVAAVLPILDTLVTGASDDPSGVGAVVAGVFRSVGLEPTLEVMLAALVAFFFLKGLALYLAMLNVGSVVARVAMDLRLRLLRAITRARWEHVLRYPTGFIGNAIAAEAGVTAAAYQQFAHILATAMQVLAYLVVAFLISWQTATAALVTGTCIMLLLQSRVSASRLAGRDQTTILRSMLARITDALPSLKPLKAMGMEQYLLPRLEEQTRGFYHAQYRAIASRELLNHGREPVIILALAAGLWALLTLTPLTSTTIMLLALLFYRAVASFTNMQAGWAGVVVGENAFQSLMSHINAAESAAERWDTTGGRALPIFERELKLEDISFSYGDANVIDGANATLSAGTFVAVVGPSGGGKTTLTDLITGLLEPQSGRILVDGVPLSETDIRTWRGQIGYVPQEPMLFTDTVRENVTLGAEDVTDGQVEAALRAASAWDFVNSLPAGTRQIIGEEGITLSGGQRQRLAIARALVTEPHLLILDEPTTALDTVSEAEVCAAITRLKGHLTVLAISHQQAIRDLADEVWVVDEGTIRTKSATETHALPLRGIE